MAFSLTRAAGALASTFRARATTGTIRAQRVTVPGRLARSDRRPLLHLPTDRLAPGDRLRTLLEQARHGPALAT